MALLADIRSLRGQAQALSEQCRDSDYRLLNRSLRNLRNAFEEAEEAFEDIPDGYSPACLEAILLHAVSQCRLVLTKFEAALHGTAKPDGFAIETLRTDLESATLGIANTLAGLGQHDKPDPRSESLVFVESLGRRSQPVSLSEVQNDGLDRKSSQTSSEWSLVNRHSPGATASSPSESVVSPHPSEEKEAYTPVTSLGSAISQTTFATGWGSPFAPDPLTMDIEHASTMILNDDERPTRKIVPQEVVELPIVIQPQLAQLPTHPSSTAGAVIGTDALPHETWMGPFPRGRDAAHFGHDHSKAESIGNAPVSASMGRPTLPALLTTTPRTLPLHSRSMSQRVQTSYDSTTFGLKADSEPRIDDVMLISRRRSATYNVERSSTTWNTEHASHTTGEKGMSLEISSDSTHSPAPTRAPPPPPPPRRTIRVRPPVPSQYHVTNPSPSSRPSSASSDELYHSSRPTSRTGDQLTIQVHSLGSQEVSDAARQAPDIPVISVDASACDDSAPDVVVPTAPLPELEGGEQNTVRFDTGDQHQGPAARTSKSEAVAELPHTSKDEQEQPPEKQQAVASEHDDHAGVQAALAEVTHASHPPVVVLVQPTFDHKTTDALPVPSEMKPPPIPRRPSRYKGGQAHRGGSSVDASDGKGESTKIPVIHDTEGGRSSLQPTVLMMKPRQSVDLVLRTEDLGSQHQTRPGAETRTSGGATRQRRGSSLQEFYGEEQPAAVTIDGEDIDLDFERINLIVTFWNLSKWDLVEAYLLGYLETLIERDDVQTARRARHLLGVCASFQGQIDRAITLFMGVLQPRLTENFMDPGTCAAAYWLGDLFALQNRRIEALLAYCIAERSPLFRDEGHRDRGQSGLRKLIFAEQAACQLDFSRAELRLQWAREVQSKVPRADTFLDTKIMSTALAQALLKPEPASSYDFQLSGDSTRSLLLRKLHSGPQSISTNRYHHLWIDESAFRAGAPWPMPYDPLFSVKNVMRGRFTDTECDLLQALATEPDSKLPKSSNAGVSRVDTFTCPDLRWLITNVRACLVALDMEWSEVGNDRGVWFMVRHSYMKSGFAIYDYFSLALFKQSFRSAYGVGIPQDVMRSSRVMKMDYNHEKGVHTSEPQRMRKLINEYLTEAWKSHPKLNKKSSSLLPTILQRTPSERKDNTGMPSNA